ncbi:MAG: hypothetical protein EOO01_12110 [Chitinophagaceae bacterium]|nr:MAG: hypothetical protein EOO01_12110 [Chitinophagaceae bacterium]
MLLRYLIFAASILIYCKGYSQSSEANPPKQSMEEKPYMVFSKNKLFPGTGSLLRPEDGVALADGRVIVSDQAKGLRLIEKDGSTRAFGKFAEAGFVYAPPEKVSAPNGMNLEHDGQHVLMCDYGDGKIYRIEIKSEKVELIYDHEYGVNSLYRDKSGAIWFTQSAKRPDGIDVPMPDGAVFRMADLKSAPVLVVDSLYLANGITMDAEEKTLFVAESLMNRVHSFGVDVSAGKIINRGIAAIVLTPDNIVVDNKGRLIVASPGGNQVIAFDLKSHSQHLFFDASTEESRKIADEWFFRSQVGLPRRQLMTKKMYGDMPGLLTGAFFSKDGKTLYIANFGKDLVKVPIP